MTQESELTLVGGTTFMCGNPADGTLLVGSFDLTASASSIEFNIIYADGDTTNYALEYTINGGTKTALTITPTEHFFTLYGSYTSFNCQLTVPYQGGNGLTNCRIRVF